MFKFSIQNLPSVVDEIFMLVLQINFLKSSVSKESLTHLCSPKKKLKYLIHVKLKQSKIVSVLCTESLLSYILAYAAMRRIADKSFIDYPNVTFFTNTHRKSHWPHAQVAQPLKIRTWNTRWNVNYWRELLTVRWLIPANREREFTSFFERALQKPKDAFRKAPISREDATLLANRSFLIV